MSYWDSGVKLYTSQKIDGREVLKPSSMEDVKEWLWQQARYSVLDQDSSLMIQRAAQRLSEQDAVREGLKKLEAS